MPDGSEVGGFGFENVKRNAMLASKGIVMPKAWSTGTTIAGIMFKARGGVWGCVCVLGSHTRVCRCALVSAPAGACAQAFVRVRAWQFPACSAHVWLAGLQNGRVRAHACTHAWTHACTVLHAQVQARLSSPACTTPAHVTHQISPSK